jgi:hypothetical protein
MNELRVRADMGRETIECESGDPLPDSESLHARTHATDPSGALEAELYAVGLTDWWDDAGCEQDIAKVETDGFDRDFDLAGSWRQGIESDELQGIEGARLGDFESMRSTVCGLAAVAHGFGHRRATQARDVSLGAAEGDLILVVVGERELGERPELERVVVVAEVDAKRSELGMLGPE